jgi:hypothetical protein
MGEWKGQGRSDREENIGGNRGFAASRCIDTHGRNAIAITLHFHASRGMFSKTDMSSQQVRLV